MGAIIVDTSALMRTVQTRPDTKKFRQIIEESDCYAPRLILSELANALWKTVRFASLDSEEAVQLLFYMESIPILADDEILIEDALDIAIQSEHPVYDCLFIALSREMNAPILTADIKLRRKFPSDTFIDFER
jgi:predicted nucleic acid-binding protein